VYIVTIVNMLKLSSVCINLLLGLATFIFALEADLREELLNSEDIEIVKSRNFRNISFTSPSNKRCLIVASSTECTRWKHTNCRAQRSVEIYDPDCSILNGRKVKNCKVQNDVVPAENTISVCGLKWTRECQGPCYNCPESCKPQFEKTCWRNQEVKNAVNIISINGVDIYTEKEYLESLYSCSQNKIADVCAPNNCRFIESPEDCIVQNDTRIVDLKTRTCTLCTAHIQQDRGTCEDILKEDCRNEFPFAWTKLCSYQGSQTKDLILPVPTSPVKKEIMADFAALYSKSLGPVNNLILNTLKDIEVGDVTNDTVIIISTPKSFTENHQGKEFEIVQEMVHDGEHISVNVSVKYDFTDQQQPEALEHKPSSTFRPRMNPLLSNEQETYKILDLPYNSEDYTHQETIDYDTAGFEDSDSYDTSNSGGTSLEDMIGRQQSGDNVYFDPLFQVLNDRDRNEISSPTITTQRYQQPTFIFNSKT